MKSLVLALSLVASPAFAQGYEQQPALDLSYIAKALFGYDYYLTSVEADNTIPGREVHVYVPGLWMFASGRWHPTKHGLEGLLPGPGLCLERWNFIQMRGPVWYYNAVGDFTNDGRDDFIVYFASGSVDIYRGVGLTVCK